MPHMFGRQTWRQYDPNFWYQITDSSTTASYDNNETIGPWFNSNNNFSITNTMTTMDYIRTPEGYRVPRFNDGTGVYYSEWHRYHPEDQIPEERLLRGGREARETPRIEDALRQAGQDLTRHDQERRRESQEQRHQAYLRATSLLREALSREQLYQLDNYDAFLVVGSRTQRTYEISMGREHNVYLLNNEGRRTWRYCAHVVDRVPNADNVLAQKFMIECNEQMFLKLANTDPLPHPVPGRVPFNLPTVGEDLREASA